MTLSIWVTVESDQYITLNLVKLSLKPKCPLEKPVTYSTFPKLHLILSVIVRSSQSITVFFFKRCMMEVYISPLQDIFIQAHIKGKVSIDQWLQCRGHPNEAALHCTSSTFTMPLFVTTFLSHPSKAVFFCCILTKMIYSFPPSCYLSIVVCVSYKNMIQKLNGQLVNL